MRTSRIIDGPGKRFVIPISDKDQSMGLSIAGEYVGMLQVLGSINQDAPEIELTPYDKDGGILDLDTVRPYNVFFDVGTFEKIIILAVYWTSGAANISAITSEAPRPRVGGSIGAGQEVKVTESVPIAVASGPFLTNAQLRQTPVNIDFESRDLLSQAVAKYIGVDHDQNPLPVFFDYVPSTFTYGGPQGDLVQTEVRTVDDSTYTRTFLYDGDLVTGCSDWVKS